MLSKRTESENAYFDITSKIFNWRKTATAIHNGKTTQYIPENDVYVYFRYNDHQTVMVVINNSKQEQTLELSRFKENIKDAKSAKEVLSDREINLGDTLTIAGKESYILEIL